MKSTGANLRVSGCSDFCQEEASSAAFLIVNLPNRKSVQQQCLKRNFARGNVKTEKTRKPKYHQCFCLLLQKSSSSESLSDKGSAELKKSFDAVVFDVLKVTPEEYAVSNLSNFCSFVGWYVYIYVYVYIYISFCSFPFPIGDPCMFCD